MSKRYPENVARAVLNTVLWLDARETWVVKGKKLGDKLRAREADQLSRIVIALKDVTGVHDIPEDVREKIMLFLAYLPAQSRVSFLLDLCQRDSIALSKIMKPVSKPGVATLNVATTLGTVVRNAMIEDVFADTRLDRAERIVRSTAQTRG